MSGDSLSAPVPVLALVGRYPTNKLIGLGPLPERQAPFGVPTFPPLPGGSGAYPGLARLSAGYTSLGGRLSKRY